MGKVEPRGTESFENGMILIATGSGAGSPVPSGPISGTALNRIKGLRAIMPTGRRREAVRVGAALWRLGRKSDRLFQDALRDVRRR